MPVATIGSPASCVAILLPGRLNRPQEFVDQGFAAALEARGLEVQLVLPDAHLGYYRDRSVVERLEQDVAGRVELDDVDVLVIAGVSLGGLGTLLWTMDGADRSPDALLLLAPFLGTEDVVAEIAEAGGVESWQPPTAFAAEDLRRPWAWMHRWAAADRRPPVWLAWGASDDLAPAIELFGAPVDARQRRVVPGGHDWDAWLAGWEWFLDHGPLRECVGNGGRGRS